MLRVNLNENEHYSCMFNKLEGMRRGNKHCNFKIKVGSEALDCHRSILAAGSDYFDAMLSHDTEENRSGIVEMINADSECVKICVGYIYGGKVEEISMEKCEQLMYVANLMQLQKLCDGITEFIGAKLDLKKYFATKRIADLFGCLKLVEKCDKFAEENFALILKTEEFGDLDKNYVKKMIKSGKVKMTEELKLEVLLRWIRQDDERKKFLEEILECVELDKVPVECVHHLLENEPLITDNLELYKMFSAFLIKATKVGMRPPGIRQLHDDREEVGIAIFDRESGFLQCFNPRANTWRQMQKMHVKMAKNIFSSVFLDDHIYVLMRNKSVYRLQYSIETANWERMSDMIENHGQCPPATVVADQIYVIGGHELVSTKAAEKYDPATDQWSKIVDKPQPSKCSELLTVGENIYSFGGYMNGKHVNKVQNFDLSLSSWTDMKPMKETKSHFATVVLDGKVYVLGGYLLNNRHLRSFDCYDADMDEWTSLSSMKTARSWFRAFAVDGFIYAVGGLFSPPGSMEKYDVEKNKWEIVPIPSGMKLLIKESVRVKFKEVANT